MYRRHKRNQILILVITLLCITIIIAGISAYQYFLPKVKRSLILEAGSKSLEAKEFLINHDKDAAFVTELSSIDLNTPGTYPVQIKTEGKIYTSALTIVDTTPPAADVTNLAAPVGNEVKPETFLSNITDAANVTVNYKTSPDFSHPGEQSLTLVLTDTSNNKTELAAVLTLVDIKKKIQLEAGTPMVSVYKFQNTRNYNLSYVTDTGKLNLNKPGVYDIEIKADNNTVTCQLEIIDTTPPAGIPADQEIWSGAPIKSEDFVKEIQDVTPVTVSFKNYVDLKKTGTQSIIVLLKDTSGNTSELSALLTIKADTEPPVITGAVDKTVYIGDTVSYKLSVTVTDNKDKDIPLNVDSSLVNLRKEGSYPVVYRAADSSGNKTEKTVTITVKKYRVDKAQLDSMAEEIVDNITNSSMTQRDKAYAIYKWTKNHISYTGYSDKSDWMKEAYNGIKKGAGDCFTYFSVSKELLTLTGIENMDITRVGGTTRHYWSLINTGDGWYHYDSCPNVDHRESFMLTDAELKALSDKRENNYYNYKKEMYPPTPEE